MKTIEVEIDGGEEMAAKLNALHEECVILLKTTLMEFCEKNVPADYHVAMMNGVSCDIMASALEATANVVARSTKPDEAGKAAEALMEFFIGGVMPEFVRLGGMVGSDKVGMAIIDKDEAPEVLKDIVAAGQKPDKKSVH